MIGPALVPRRAQRATATVTFALAITGLMHAELQSGALAAITANLGAAALLGPSRSPTGMIWRTMPGLLRGPRETEAGARFAAACGLAVALFGGGAAVSSWSEGAGGALLLLAALSGLLAAADICFGCRLYGLLHRPRAEGVPERRRRASAQQQHDQHHRR